MEQFEEGRVSYARVSYELLNLLSEGQDVIENRAYVFIHSWENGNQTAEQTNEYNDLFNNNIVAVVDKQKLAPSSSHTFKYDVDNADPLLVLLINEEEISEQYENVLRSFRIADNHLV